jgi:hypothetical protein
VYPDPTFDRLQMSSSGSPLIALVAARQLLVRYIYSASALTFFIRT